MVSPAWSQKTVDIDRVPSVGSLLSRDQIRQAFQAAGYSPEDVGRFTDVVETRIDELKSL